MTTTRILVPAAYVDAYRAAPHADTPPAVHTVLMTADLVGNTDSNRRAVLDVDPADLPGFRAVADEHFRTWSETLMSRKRTMPFEEAHALARRARTAFLVLQQVTRYIRQES